MKCKTCSRNILEHTDAEVYECLGIEPGTNPYELASSLGMSLVIRPKHGIVEYRDNVIQNSKNIELDILRLCLLKKKPKQKPRETEKVVVELQEESATIVYTSEDFVPDETIIVIGDNDEEQNA